MSEKKRGKRKRSQGASLLRTALQIPCPVEVEPGKPCGKKGCAEHWTGPPTVGDLMRVQARVVSEPFYPKYLWTLVRSAALAHESQNLDLEEMYLKKLADIAANAPGMRIAEQVSLVRDILVEVRNTKMANAKLKADNEGMYSPQEVKALMDGIIRTIRVYLPDPVQQERFANDIKTLMLVGKQVLAVPGERKGGA